MAGSFSQFDSDPAAPTSPIKNAKRGAEEAVEPQVVGNKKHKIMEKKNSRMETEESIKEDHCSPQEQNKVEFSPSLKLVTTSQDAKKANNSNEPRKEDEDDKDEVPRALRLSATTHDDAERANISDEYEEEEKDDSSKDHHQYLETPKRDALKPNNDLLVDHPMMLDLITEGAEHHPTHDTGSKTLFLGNLSFSIEEDDVRDFFKNVGDIAEIRFAIKDDRFLGYGYTEFTTAEAAQEALKLNKEVLLDRRVKLEFARQQRGAYTPGNSNSMDRSNQREGHAQVTTVYVRGFESSDGFDNIRNALEKHFEKCGEISRLDIPKDHVSRGPRGVAFIEFTDSNGFSKALGLDGSEVKGSRLTVERAKRQKGDARYGGGGWHRESGSGGGWQRESGYGGGWGWESRSSYDGHWSRGSDGELSARRVGNGNGFGGSSTCGRLQP